MSDWVPPPRVPKPGEFQCAGCQDIKPEVSISGLTPRVGTNGLKFCIRCPACPCGRPDCDADANRALPHGGALFAHESFVLNADNHYIHVMDRPCNVCGEKSGSWRDKDNPTPPPDHTCWVCKKCIHYNRDHSGENHTESFRLLILGPHDHEYERRGKATWWDVHAECLHCPKCDFTEPLHTWGHDAGRDWAVTRDHQLVHLACATCEFCNDPRGRGKKRVGHLWTEDDRVGVVHDKHLKELSKRCSEFRARERAAEATTSLQAASLAPRPVAVKRKGIPRTRKPPKQ